MSFSKLVILILSAHSALPGMHSAKDAKASKKPGKTNFRAVVAKIDSKISDFNPVF